MDYLVSKAVHEQATNFLEDANNNGFIEDAIPYLAALSSRGDDNDFSLNRLEIIDTLKKSARSLGIVKEDGSVNKTVQMDLRNFFFDRDNIFLAQNKYNPEKEDIDEMFSVAQELLEKKFRKDIRR